MQKCAGLNNTMHSAGGSGDECLYKGHEALLQLFNSILGCGNIVPVSGRFGKQLRGKLDGWCLQCERSDSSILSIVVLVIAV